MSRLTKAQIAELQHICGYADWGGAPYRAWKVADYSAPLRRLIRRGLVELKPHPTPKYRSNFRKVIATPAGRAALASHRQENEHG